MSTDKHIYGFHAVLARLRQAPQSVVELYLDQSRRDKRASQLIDAVKGVNVSVQLVSSHSITELLGHAHHQGVLARIKPTVLARHLDEVLDRVSKPLLLVLDGIQDPHNLGACLRCADAFGVHAVIVPKDRAVGVTATVSKVASGAAETVPIITVTNLARTLRELKERGIWLIGTDAEAANSLYEADLKGSLAWVMGGESTGMRRLTRELCDTLVQIPLYGSVTSLNVAVATGICLYATKQFYSRLAD